MKTRVSTLAILFALLGLVFAGPLSVTAARPTQGSTSTFPATGSVTNTATGLATDISSLSVVQFVNQNGQLAAVVNLLDSAGTVLAQVTAPVTNVSGSCTILDLTLGPLHLDLLGLVVDLNQVHLTITAQSGPGNLLGNLLCAVAHLLDSNATGGALAGLLNRILALLG